MPATRAPTVKTHSTGPRTDQGKARSSANATQHGLGGYALVLKGESVSGYAANQDAWFTALAPTTKAEGQLVAQLADVAWRLDRCSKLEHRRHLAVVEEKAMQTPEYKTCSSLWHRLWVANVIVDQSHRLATAQPFPAKYREIEGFLTPLARSVTALKDAEVPDFPLKKLGEAVEALDAAALDDDAKPEHVAQVAAVGREIQDFLGPKLADAEKALEAKKEQMGTGLVVPVDKESKKLARYRGELEKSQARLLDNLSKVREMVKAARQDGGSSFREADPPVSVRLRVVR
jgi:hypothetical protein